jgi:glycosyltransferase involved in cell wall biosynthesis
MMIARDGATGDLEIENPANTTRRKVLLVTDDLGAGGAERQLVLVAKSLPPEWSAAVWSVEGGRFVDDLAKAGIPCKVAHRAFAQDPRPVLDLLKFTRRHKPQVVHSWGWMSTLAAALVCRLCGIPHVNGMIRKGAATGRRTRMFRSSAKLGDLIVANSKAGLSAFGIPAEKGRVLYNAFDASRLQSFVRTKDPAANPMTIVMAAGVDDRKDFASFVSAARICAAQAPPETFRFLVVGDGSLLPAIKSAAGELVDTETVVFTGRVPEVTEYLKQADIGVLMSNSRRHGEGLSNSIMEYMACGLPVICSDGGGNRELVIDGTTGFVIPPLSAEDLAAKIQWMRANPGRASEMGNAGRERVLQEFTVEKMVGTLIEIYAEVLA